MSCAGDRRGYSDQCHALRIDAYFDRRHAMGIKLMGLFSAVMHWGWMELISLVSCTVWAQTGFIVIAVRYSHCHAQSEHRTILTNVMDAFGMNTAVLTTYWV